MGGEVYHAREAGGEQRSVLAFQPWSRWFQGFPRPRTPADDRAQEPGVVRLEAVSTGQPRMVATSPPYPARVSDVPRVDQGASLSLRIESTEDPDIALLHLTLKGTERPLWREVEHRHTNILPFLFAFYADGEPVHKQPGGSAIFGGVSRFVQLTDKDRDKTWSVRADLGSVRSLLGERDPKTVEIVAAFSERQHIGYAGLDAALPSSDVVSPSGRHQVVVRSNRARLPWANR